MATQKTLTLAERPDVVKSHEEVPLQSQKEIAAKYEGSVATINRILKNRQSL